MATPPPNFDPNQPFDPANVNDPRYDPRRDPRYDPRWQKAQERYYAGQQRAQANQQRAAQRAQDAAFKMQARAQRDQWRMYLRGQRRPSIIGPLLLIAIGVVFLLIHTGRISAVAFFTWYGHFWPLLLITVGVLRLIEWGIDRMRQPGDASPMRYSVGGGAVFTVILLSFIGVLVAHGAQWHEDRQHGFDFFTPEGWNNGFFGQRHEENAPDKVRSIAATGTLSIENPHGDVTISGTSDDGQVHLSARKEAYTNSDSAAANLLRELTPVFEGTDSSLTLRVPQVESGSTDLTLLVPSTVHVFLNSDHGDVHVTNLKSPLTVTSNNGDVEIAAITGNVQLHANHRRRDLNVRSVTGDVIVDGNGDEVNLSDINGSATIHGDFSGGGHLQHITGAVQYHSSRTDLSMAHLTGDLQLDSNDLSANEVSGPVLVSTRSRNITLDKVTGDIKVVNSHGDVDVHVAPPTGSVTVDNQNGNVNVSLPEQARFTLNAETSDGDTSSEFSGTGRHGGRGTLSGTVNGGGQAVRLNTSHGDINVSRNTNAPLPPAPATPAVTGFGTIASSPVAEAPGSLDGVKPAAAQAKTMEHPQRAKAKEKSREAEHQATGQSPEAPRE